MNRPTIKTAVLSLLAGALCCLSAKAQPTPSVVSASSFRGTSIGLLYNQAMDPVSAAAPANYTAVSGGLSVTGGQLEPDGMTVVLSLSGVLAGPTFSVTINNVNGLASNSIAPNTVATGKVVFSQMTDAAIGVGTTAVPPGVVTRRGPVVTPAAAVAIICVVELTLKDAAFKELKVTAVAPLNPAPLMVTTVPALPPAGVKLVMVGPEDKTKEPGLVAVPAATVTVTLLAVVLSMFTFGFGLGKDTSTVGRLLGEALPPVSAIGTQRSRGSDRIDACLVAGSIRRSIGMIPPGRVGWDHAVRLPARVFSRIPSSEENSGWKRRG